MTPVDPDSAGNGSDPLESAGQDADSSFGFEPVNDVVTSCSQNTAATALSAEKKHWVEILMLDKEGNPVPGIAYRVRVPGGQVVEGSLDGKGRARVDGIDAGSCQIAFPGLDTDVWEKK